MPGMWPYMLSLVHTEAVPLEICGPNVPQDGQDTLEEAARTPGDRPRDKPWFFLVAAEPRFLPWFLLGGKKTTAVLCFSVSHSTRHLSFFQPPAPMAQAGPGAHKQTARCAGHQASAAYSGTAFRMQASPDEKIKKGGGGAGQALASAARRDCLQWLLRTAVGIDQGAAILQSKPSTSRQKRDLAMPRVKFVFIHPLLCPHRCMHACMPMHRHSPLPTISLACGHSPEFF